MSSKSVDKMVYLVIFPSTARYTYYYLDLTLKTSCWFVSYQRYILGAMSKMSWAMQISRPSRIYVKSSRISDANQVANHATTWALLQIKSSPRLLPLSCNFIVQWM